MPSDIIKTTTKIGAWLFGGFCKVASLSLRAVGTGIGAIVGSVVSGLVMSYDIDKYLEFYSKRLIYRYLINLSFNKIEEYLKNKFESEEQSNNDN